MMTITYKVGNSIYVNMTNRCPCACTFCLRQNGPGVYGSDSLWLDREPTVEETCKSLDEWDLDKYDEIVFCGYGEPTERIDDLLEVAAHIKSVCKTPVRINTNGLGNLISGRHIEPEMKGLIDTLSISLNSDNADEYYRIVRPKFGPESYQAMLDFAKAAKEYVPNVKMTIVGSPVTTEEEQENCRRICERIGVTLRIRAYEN